MIQIVKKGFALSVLIIMLTMAVSYGQDLSKGVVMEKNTVLLTQPKDSGKVVKWLSIGEEVFIDHIYGQWYKVSTNKGSFGWVHRECLFVKQSDKKIYRGIINTENVEVKKEADIQSENTGQLGFATKVWVVEKSQDWYQLVMGDQIIGWVPKSAVQILPDEHIGKIITDGCKIYKESRPTNEVKGSFQKDEKVMIKDVKGEHFYVKGKNLEGWIYRKYLQVMHEDYFYQSFMDMKRAENKSKNLALNGEYDDIIKDAKFLGDDFWATSYDLSVASCGKPVGSKNRGYTRSGYNLNGKMWKDAMVVGANLKTLPLGSKILVLFDSSDWHKKYNGIYLVADTGGRVGAKQLDIYLGDGGNDHIPEVFKFGRTKKVKVYLLK